MSDRRLQVFHAVAKHLSESPMRKCAQGKLALGRVGRRVIEADISGGDLSSDGGLLLLRQADRRIGLTRAAATALPDPRDPERIRHGLREMLAQRVYGLCCGYEDLNDHRVLRRDVLMQSAVGRAEPLAWECQEFCV